MPPRVQLGEKKASTHQTPNKCIDLPADLSLNLNITPLRVSHFTDRLKQTRWAQAPAGTPGGCTWREPHKRHLSNVARAGLLRSPSASPVSPSHSLIPIWRTLPSPSLSRLLFSYSYPQFLLLLLLSFAIRRNLLRGVLLGGWGRPAALSKYGSSTDQVYGAS